MKQPRIAFLGLGIMGSGMARRVIEGGFPVTVYNRNAARAEPLVAMGAALASTPREAAARSDIIFGMVSDDIASQSLWFGKQGAVAGIVPGAVCIESSTLSVGWVIELARAVAARGCEFLDGPVTGSKAQLPTGQLKFLIGGSTATLDKIKSVLAVMSTEVIHLGPVGSGALMKLINNSLNGVQIAAFAEALALIEGSGMDIEKAVGVITAGAAGSPIVKTVAARMMSRDYTPHFNLALLAKDLRYAIAEGEQRGQALTLALSARQRFGQAVDAGHGAMDMAVVIEAFRKH